MKNYFLIILFISSISISYAQQSKFEKIYVNKKKSSISYSMKHPLHTWNAISNEVSSIILLDREKMDIKELAVVVKIASFDSKNSNRDSNMIEVTEALKFPNVSLSSTAISQRNDKLIVKGILKFHGVSKEIIFEVEKEILKNEIKITGDFSILMTDFEIKPPTLLGIATDENIDLSFIVYY
jgi:polyisoprenoid-binding protein YceI